MYKSAREYSLKGFEQSNGLDTAQYKSEWASYTRVCQRLFHIKVHYVG